MSQVLTCRLENHRGHLPGYRGDGCGTGFEKWVSEQDGFFLPDIREFHHGEKYDHQTENDDTDNEHRLFTLSITSIRIDTIKSIMFHEDLESKMYDVKALQLKVKVS